MFATRSEIEWRRDTLTQIRNLRWLAAGWDGPGSLAMNRVAVATACDLVDWLAVEFPNLRPPTVVPTADAGVFIEWYDPQRTIAFTVRVADEIELCYEDTARGIDREGQIADLPFADWVGILLAHQC